ncbi:hypothetical protein NM688_g8764 [Phlebia brevispora]|uniref:Uncharacterized protein n=1 Tax=Phlebia brevispora TaxID=194682 RepID=A0ACC1RQ32_9APHY|nr:hypothetical protein NM688_g8764 [Phlebia brevispora]
MAEEAAQRLHRLPLLFYSLGISERNPPVYPTHFKHKRVHELLHICREYTIPFKKNGKHGKALRKDLENAIIKWINGAYTHLDSTAESQGSNVNDCCAEETETSASYSHNTGNVSTSITPHRQTTFQGHHSHAPTMNTWRMDLFEHQRDFVPLHSYNLDIASGADLDLRQLAMAIGVTDGCLVLDPVYRRPFASRRPGFIAADELVRLVDDNCLSIIGMAFSAPIHLVVIGGSDVELFRMGLGTISARVNTDGAGANLFSLPLPHPSSSESETPKQEALRFPGRPRALLFPPRSSWAYLAAINLPVLRCPKFHQAWPFPNGLMSIKCLVMAPKTSLHAKTPATFAIDCAANGKCVKLMRTGTPKGCRESSTETLTRKPMRAFMESPAWMERGAVGRHTHRAASPWLCVLFALLGPFHRGHRHKSTRASPELALRENCCGDRNNSPSVHEAEDDRLAFLDSRVTARYSLFAMISVGPSDVTSEHGELEYKPFMHNDPFGDESPPIIRSQASRELLGAGGPSCPPTLA